MKADLERKNRTLKILIVVAVICIIVLIFTIVMLTLTEKATSSDDEAVVYSDPTTVTTYAQITDTEQDTSTDSQSADGTTVASADSNQSNSGSSSSSSQVTTASTDDLSSLTTAEIAANMTSAIAQVKSNATFTGRKQQVISIEVVDCSVSAATSLVNSILQNFIDDTDETYTFSNGTATNTSTGETSTTTNAIPPSDIVAYIDPNGLTSATAEKSGDNIVYTVKFASEATTLESPIPYYHAQAMDYLDLAGLDISPAKITQADLSYPGATEQVTVNSSGQIIGYYIYMPVSGTGGGSLGLSVSGTIEGYLEETWTFTW